MHSPNSWKAWCLNWRIRSSLIVMKLRYSCRRVNNDFPRGLRQCRKWQKLRLYMLKWRERSSRIKNEWTNAFQRINLLWTFLPLRRISSYYKSKRTGRILSFWLETLIQFFQNKLSKSKQTWKPGAKILIQKSINFTLGTPLWSRSKWLKWTETRQMRWQKAWHNGENNGKN